MFDCYPCGNKPYLELVDIDVLVGVLTLVLVGVDTLELVLTLLLEEALVGELLYRQIRMKEASLHFEQISAC